MSSRFCHCSSLHLLIGLFIFGSISAISAHENENPNIKTMEAFSGYPIHESNSLVTDFVSSLSVETQTLQNQIDELSTFSDSPAPSVTRILYSEKDRYIKQYNDIELSALGMAIPTVVTIAEILKRDGLAKSKEVKISTVDSKEDREGHFIQKAKIQIVMGKAEKLDKITSDAAAATKA